MGLVGEVTGFFAVIGEMFSYFPVAVRLMIITCFGVAVLIGVLRLVHN